MSESNSLARPLGPGVPLPGGDPVNTPAPRTAGGAPGGGGNALGVAPSPPAGATPKGVGDLPAPPQQPGMSFEESRTTLMQQHKRNLAAVENLSKALKNIDLVRKGLNNLADKQDLVTLEDVVHEASKLVSRGIDPIALAGVIADAPQNGGGEALGAWVAGHAATAEQAEVQISQQYNLAQHNKGVSAMHLLMAHANVQAMLGGISPPMGGEANPLQGEAPAPHPDLGDTSPMPSKRDASPRGFSNYFNALNSQG